MFGFNASHTPASQDATSAPQHSKIGTALLYLLAGQSGLDHRRASDAQTAKAAQQQALLTQLSGLMSGNGLAGGGLGGLHQDGIEAGVGNANAMTREGLMSALAPALMEQGNYGALFGMIPDAPKKSIVEGPDGIYEVTEGGPARKVQDYPAKPETLPPGWKRDPKGMLYPEPNGPADPSYIARTAGVRRDAIVSRPMPHVGGRGHGGGGASSAPWKKNWGP